MLKLELWQNQPFHVTGHTNRAENAFFSLTSSIHRGSLVCTCKKGRAGYQARTHLTDDLLCFLDDLLHDLFNDGIGDLALGLSSLFGLGKTSGKPLFPKDLLFVLPPREEFIEKSLAHFDDLLVSNVNGVFVFLVELAGVFAEILADGLLLFLAEEGSRAGTPEELLELLRRVLGEDVAGEAVDVKAVFELCSVSRVSDNDGNMIFLPGESRQRHC